MRSTVAVRLAVGALLLIAAGCGGGDAGGAGQASAPADSAAAAQQEDSQALINHGVNYDLDAPEGSLSWTPLKLEARAQLAGGDQVELAADFTSWIAGSVLAAPLGSAEQIAAGCTISGDGASGDGTSGEGASGDGTSGGATAECPLSIVRLAQYGTAGGEEGGTAFEWLLQAADGGQPTGTVSVTLTEDGSASFPAEVSLDAELELTIQQPGGEPQALRSRAPVALAGSLEEWPMGLLILTQQGEGTELYAAADGEEAPAALTLSGMVMAFADKPSELFRRVPEITEVSVVDAAGESWSGGDVGGVRLTWTDTAADVLASYIVGYKLYRNPDPNDSAGWQMVTRLPAGETSYTDTNYDGSETMAYLVSHEIEYPFGSRYEGIYEQPTVVEAVEQ